MVALLGLVGAVTATIVLRAFRHEIERREATTRAQAVELLGARLATIESAVANAARDPELARAVQRELLSSRESMEATWRALAAKHLAPRYDLPVLKVLDAEGIVLSNARWTESYGLQDTAGLIFALESNCQARLVQDREQEEFLALESACWFAAPRRYVVAGGVLAGDVERELANTLGIPEAHFEFRDANHARHSSNWIALPLASPRPTASQATSEANAAEASLALSTAAPQAGVRLVFDRAAVTNLGRRLAELFVVATVIGIVVAWSLGLWMSSRITKPIEELARGVTTLAVGGTPHTIREQGSSEVRELVRSFNAMSQSLHESRERLRRVERVAAWGDVARRIAHEIKNAMLPIQLSVENVARSVHTGRGDLATLADESVTTVQSEVAGLTQLVDSFNEVARMPEPQLGPHTLRDTWERAAAAFRGRIQVDQRGSEALPRLLYDDDQIRRAFHNLIRNACEAGAERIGLAARLVELGGATPLEARGGIAVAGGIHLSIEDDGPGIDAADLPRIFEPYFTRKPEGTGLGLAIVYKVFVDHDWSVNVESPVEASGRGTRFVIRLPARAIASGTEVQRAS